MLVLTRRTGEQIVIGDDIVLTVTSGGGDRVRLGFAAPPHIRIDRKEIHDLRKGLADARDCWQDPYHVIT
jgi:carbon storage regulator CsrA